MRKFQFRSLTMRIWITFTMVILIIILCLSLIYGYVFRFMDTKAKIQDLSVAHSILLESDYNEPMRFDTLRNLRGVSHFVIHANSDISDVGKPQGNAPNGSRPQLDNMPLPEPNRSNLPPVQFDNMAVKNWITSFAVGDMDRNEFRQSYNGMDFIFVISSVDSGDYFISYMPNFYNNSIMYYILAIGGLFIAVGFIAAKIVANYISKPLSELEKYTIKIAAKDWKKPISLKNDDEIGRLAVSMNKMQEALKRADEEEKLFLQSISHDLKTPVMVIMSHADAIIDGIYIDTLDKTAQIIKDEAISLNRRIKQLLYLNTLDYVLGNQSETSVIELNELIKHISQRFEILGGHLKWNLDIDKIKIKGNEEKLTVAIENILDNALRYAKTEISISLKLNEKFVRLEIFNDGNAIKPENLDKIFDNMYKDKTGNFGLGLAITKKIISFFGGIVYTQNKENGVSFIIKYPIS